MKTQKLIVDPVREALRRFDPAFAPVYIKQYDDQSQVDLIVVTWCSDFELYATLWAQFVGLFQITSFIWVNRDSSGNDKYSIVLKADRLHVQPPISEKE